MKRLLFTILALCVLCMGLQAQNTNTTNNNGVTSQGQLDTVRNTRIHPTTQDGPVQSNFVDQFGKAGQRPGLSPYGQRLKAVIKITSSSIVSNSVLATTASIAATVSDSGDYALPVIERGVCYATTANPTLLTATKVADATISGKGFGDFNVSVSGLNPNTEYHARAYAVSLYDTVYGADLTFTTLLAGTLSYATLVVNKLSVDAAFTNPLTKVGDGTVSYARSAGDNICTVNPNTGLVTLNGTAGTCTITATVTGGTAYYYSSSTASYTLTVDTATLLQTPLTLEATTAGTIKVNNPKSGMQYNLNNGTKITMTETTTIDVAEGDKVQFFGNGTNITSYNGTNIAYGTAQVKAYGNIMSLVNETGYDTATTLTGTSTFYQLFWYNDKLTDATDLQLPATTLTSSCYGSMFAMCSHLAKAPALPAETLATSCYADMFYNCTSLTTAPALPAETLATSCYQNMFYQCTGLSTAPELPAMTLEESCYYDMFNGCTSLSSAPTLPATTLASNCYNQMFSGCTSLTSAPALPATTLASDCYNRMFYYCTSLSSAPTLPATTLASSCYDQMFNHCTSLTSAPALPATTLASGCYSAMFYQCTSLTTAPALPAKTLAAYCYEDMFNGCSSLNNVTCLATDISAEYCTSSWLNGVASEGTFTAASTNWPISASGIPSGWTKILDLSKVTGNQTVPDGWIITDTLAGNYKISIADGATVTLAGVDINGSGTWTSGNYAGLNCVGNATITLADGTTNTVKGFENHYPSIHVPSGSTLTIQGETAGTGTLNAIKNQYSAGIGCGYNIGCGNITINSGTITATEGLGTRGAGIGGCNNSSCGDITINGGTITAQGGAGGAGIGCGGYPDYTSSHCGNITINGGIVTAYAGSAGGAAGIGSAGDPSSSCGDITIMSTVTRVTATKGAGATNSIGKGSSSSTCGTVTFGNATVYNGSAWSPNPMVAGNYGGLMLAISTTTNSKDTWTLTPCLFSVSSSEKVYFSQGNLQATTTDLGANWSWAFAENQWDYIGHAASNNCISGNGTVSTNGTVDLFGWVGASSTWTGAAQYGIINSIAINNTNGYGNVANEALKSDWGNTIGMGWRTLTKDEWTYLFITRTSGSNINGTSNARYTQATINTDNGSGGVYGMILFPDGVTIAAEETTAWGTINGNSDWDTDTKCTSAQWTALAAKGCVFLPAAGYRHLTTVGNDSSEGYYWSSSPSTSSENEAYLVFFNFAGSLNIVDNMRFYGYSVRLVHTSKPMGSLSYATTSVNKTMTDNTPFTNTLTFTGDGTVSYAVSSGDDICTVDASTGEVTLNGTIGSCTITATVTEGPLYAYNMKTASYTLTVTPVGTLPGQFTINSAGGKVNFSMGNLQYQANSTGAASAPYSGVWRFAEHQYDMIGSDNANISDSYTGWIDLLGWGTGDAPTKSSTNNNDYSTFTDWGTNAISNGGNTANMWSTLTKDEWVYIFANHTKGWSTVNGVNGYVIRPDGISTAVASSYTAADWAVEEAAGSVFLPAACSRGGTAFNAGVGGDYWSSTPNNSTDAYYLYFYSGTQNPAASAGRFGGRAVRLVYETPVFLGAGTSEDPYLISSEADWNYLAIKVNSGTSYAGKFFRQTANISISTMVGNSSESKPFSGTYDGNGKTLNLTLDATTPHTAPFRFIVDATIKNVVTTGTVYSTSNHPSGLVGFTDGTCTIQNCRVSANVGGAAHSGGIVGHCYHANISIIGCVYSGTLSPASGQWTGGIIGWGGDDGGHTISISDCLFAGNFVYSTSSTKFHPIGILQNQSNTKYLSNTYYTLGAQNTNDDASFVKGLSYKGKFARSITAGTDVTAVTNAGAATVYDVSGITSYGTGILYGGVLYAGNGEAISLTLSHAAAPTGSVFSQYTVTGGGSLNTPTSNSPTLTMTDANQVINALFINPNNYKLPGAFSVGSNKVVYFSQGNLQYQASNDRWRFAKYQYNYVGDATHGNVYLGETKCDNANISSTYAGWIDLFGWATSGNSASGMAYQPWSTSTTNSDYGTVSSGEWTAANSDWGVVNAAQLGSGWRTLTHNEWVYLINTRTNASNLRTFATVNGVVGLILMPDGWTANGVGLAITTSNYTTNIISLDDWNTLESQGCVFLPSDGYRGGDNNTTCNLVQDHGSYWSSTAYNSEHAYYLDVKTSGLDPSYENNRRIGLSVRLVSETCFAGSGTAEDPYLIHTEEDWNHLADKVNSGTNYAGKYFLQTADIGTAQEPVTRMVSIYSDTESDKRPFSGTFDGQGHTLTVNYPNQDFNTRTAPFSYVYGATIRNLIVAGNCGSGGSEGRAAGIVGECNSLTTITNCVSSVNISGGPYIGGISIGGHYHIEGCLFNGTINGTSQSGGLVGYAENDTKITNCLFAPQNGSNISGGTFYHIGSYTGSGGPVTNSYYMTLLGDAQGKQARSITAGTDVTINGLGAASVTYDVSGITAYAHGIKYNGVYYAGNGEAVSLTLSHADAPTGFSFSQYTVSGGGTLANPTTNSPTLTMTDADQTINAEWTFTQTFNYTGAVQTFTVPATGYYTLECYGAQGGFSSNGLGGNGGWSQLTYPLTQGDVLYIYVGGQGGSIADYSGHPEGGDGGWNGGGKGGSGVQHQGQGSYYSGGGGGGGATHIATSDIGPITGSTDFTSNHANLLLIAGGGGGGLSWGSNAGGAGGGAEGGKGRRNSEWNIAWNNGTLSCGKDGMTSSTGSGSAEGCGGGGAGYQGGNTWTVNYNANDQSYSGAGGSSWGETSNGKGYSTTIGGATAGGNGKVVITWYGTTYPTE